MIVMNEEKRIAKSSKKGTDAEKELEAFRVKIGAPVEALEGDILRVKPRRLLKAAVAEAEAAKQQRSMSKR